MIVTVKKLAADIRTNKKVLKDASYFVALRGVQIVLGFLTTYFIVRGLSKETFGEYHFILSCAGLLSVFSLNGLNSSVMQAIARNYPGTYRKSVPIAFFSSLIGSAIMLAIAGWYFVGRNYDLATGLLLATGLFPFTHGLTQWKSIQAGHEKFGAYFLHNSLSLLVMNGLVIAAVLLMPGNLLGPLLFVFLIPSLQNALMTYLNFKNIPADAPVEEGNTAYGIKTSLYSCLTIASTHIDKLLLFTFLTPAALATYVAADRIAELFRSFTQDFASVLGPKFAKHEHYTKRLDNYFRLFSLAFGASTILFAFTILPWLMILVFGHDYKDSIPYAQALLCAAAIGNTSIFRFRFIRSKIDTKSFRNITLSTSIAHILMSAILIPWHGIQGAVVSVFLYRLIVALVVDTEIRKKYPIK